MVAIALALADALVAAALAVLQRLGVESAPASAALRPSLLAHAVRRGAWLVGIALLPLQFALQAIALRFGSLTVVQPVLTVELLFLVAILAVFFHHRPGRREWAAAAAVVAGLAAFIATAAPTGGRGAPDARGWMVVGVGAGIGVAVLVLGSLRGPRWWRATALGAASAVLFAVNATLTKALTALIQQGWGHVFPSAVPYVLAVTGLSGFFLLQSALHAGPITASRASSVTVNPGVSILIGVTVLGEHLRAGTGMRAAQIVSLVVFAAGIVALARSPLIARSTSEREFLGAPTLALAPAPEPPAP